jgi:hypothetical protein
MRYLLEKLNGRKSTIVAVIMTTTAFLTLKSIIDLDTQVYIDSVVTILAFGANYANYKLGKNTVVLPQDPTQE